MKSKKRVLEMTLNLEKLQGMILSASTLRNKIIWVVGNSNTGKTKLLKQLTDIRKEFNYIDINKFLCETLIEHSSDNQKFFAGIYLSEMLDQDSAGVWILDNIEVLFSQKLKLSPVDALKRIANQSTLIVAWPGRFENNQLIYGGRNHPDYCEYQLDSAPVLNLNNTNNQG
jgi:ABC-type transporter Mla maintaining outer membrane lipid asymmetry ATPase subunit MlaF